MSTHNHLGNIKLKNKLLCKQGKQQNAPMPLKCKTTPPQLQQTPLLR